MVKVAWNKRRHFNAYVHRQKCLNNDKKSFDILKLPESDYSDHFGSFMDDDFAMHDYYRHHNHFDEETTVEKNSLAAQSAIWLFTLLVVKTMFVACIAGGFSYAFLFVFARALKNIFTDKSQLL